MANSHDQKLDIWRGRWELRPSSSWHCWVFRCKTRHLSSLLALCRSGVLVMTWWLQGEVCPRVSRNFYSRFIVCMHTVLEMSPLSLNRERDKTTVVYYENLLLVWRKTGVVLLLGRRDKEDSYPRLFAGSLIRGLQLQDRFLSFYYTYLGLVPSVLVRPPPMEAMPWCTVRYLFSQEIITVNDAVDSSRSFTVYRLLSWMTCYSLSLF
jgi:hypothetical protein